MKRNLLLLITLIILFLKSFPTTAQILKPSKENIFYPEIGIESEGELGSTLVNKTIQEVYDGIHLNKKLEKSTFGAFVSIEPTDLYLVQKSAKWNYYVCVDKCYIQQDKLVKSFVQNLYSVLMISPDLKYYKIVPSLEPVNLTTELTDPALIRATKSKDLIDLKPKKVVLNKELSFKQEFIYNGKVGNSIKFIYREFSDDFARPSFTQDIQYDLNESSVVGFKGLKIDVLSASNTLIKYKVLSYFNSK
ncbi:hypothetical protein EGI26_11735 [Lacihabitans sp. CCS-44]|uniref:hypothetical protein n=1 Tax=Lacihabitans sp. CCS-44 TaxID=2487331 RepID=UPI0020CFB412|nr:hypothetical protein [Lacihabitans sp. CCS-44]MCP9755827.1 hypothetical protein [Lacihabitans sp. CCS-44]